MTNKRRTRSSCTPETEQGTHLFDISGYSTYKGMGNNNFVTSNTFSVGGHDWYVRFYPDGYQVADDYQGVQSFISVYLVLLTKGAKVRASCDLSLVDHDTGLPSSVHWTQPRMFVHGEDSAFAPQIPLFKDCSELESSVFLRDDNLTIQCDVTVYKEPRVSTCEFYNQIEEPPSDITKKLGKLLETGEFSDVTFLVGGETFKAHRMVLAMQSPVFKAKLYGPMREATAKHVAIEDMEPAVFQALLHFIYTGSLPNTSVIWRDIDYDMVQHLLVAADRYSVDNLKLACESMLCKNLSIQSAVAMMTLAYQHNCYRLKDACFEFITGSSATYRAVVATQEFKDLKESRSPIIADILEDALERTSKIRRM
ncbi:BTB/POZ and MATH domain-containing protein 2 [Dichanthelium oligosanthes]|uniref:BTB/POZ and MATH domain-containing protein 2 n=1 Tax=Dichanthelium oligosanthes TaxID=888268 RepID=A0A1E5VSR8_9POAL|nr:BTB/POZ and MATH domain-containing protein 2 [Dichanthelium oligosanthes]